MLSLKKLLLLLMAGSSSAFAVPLPQSTVSRDASLKMSTIAPAPPLDLKVCQMSLLLKSTHSSGFYHVLRI